MAKHEGRTSRRKVRSKHGKAALRLCPGRFILQDVPVFGEYAIDDAYNIGSDPISWPAGSREPTVNDHVLLIRKK
jgi:hypothetical protein